MKRRSPDTPDRLTEDPPQTRYCDIVLNGGVASGVVYPWAMIELARHYRFKNIGGNSVGAIAAAVGAAAEYGRCHGVVEAFEPLRQLPLNLAEEDRQGRTKMLRLFEPSASVQRLFDLFITWTQANNRAPTPAPGTATQQEAPPAERAGWREGLSVVMRVYRLGPVALWMGLLVLGLVAGLLSQADAPLRVGALALPLGLLAIGGVAAAVVVVFLFRLIGDLRALAANGYGLCTGRSQASGGEGLVEWLHRGVQLSAGRGRHDPPLTFADLWAAPRAGVPGPRPLPGGLEPPGTGISLQMFTSNVTQGRPVRLPLNDPNTRLFYDPQQWRRYFPDHLLEALGAASLPYAPQTPSDPDPLQPLDAAQAALMGRLRELPGAGMPIVVAARLSLSFPFLFSFVPVYAIDFEAPRDKRRLRLCQFTDGGLCTNFPVHLFDAAHPRWPTFALLLDERLTPYEKQEIWLPRREPDGRGDNWQRRVPGARGEPPDSRGLRGIEGLLIGMLLTMKDWNDRVTARLPQVRNRTIRLALQPGEGQLNIGMPGERILDMAHRYGTRAGRRLVRRFAPDSRGRASAAWRQHLFVRAMVQLRALRRNLRQYAVAAQADAETVPLRQLLEQAAQRPVVMRRRERQQRPPDVAVRFGASAAGADAAAAPGTRAAPRDGDLLPDDVPALIQAVTAVEVLERELQACEASLSRYQPLLEPELRLRPPV